MGLFSVSEWETEPSGAAPAGDERIATEFFEAEYFETTHFFFYANKIAGSKNSKSVFDARKKSVINSDSKLDGSV